ncbi:MAG: thioesterase domain-containing protein, partial [Cyanobacteria bacterium P01_A01_bin.17]
MTTLFKARAKRLQPWLSVTPLPDAVHLFCFPYAGGSSAIYRSWEMHLSPQIQLCPVELPGRGQRFNESPFQTLPSLVADLGAALL